MRIVISIEDIGEGSGKVDVTSAPDQTGATGSASSAARGGGGSEEADSGRTASGRFPTGALQVSAIDGGSAPSGPSSEGAARGVARDEDEGPARFIGSGAGGEMHGLAAGACVAVPEEGSGEVVIDAEPEEDGE